MSSLSLEEIALEKRAGGVGVCVCSFVIFEIKSLKKGVSSHLEDQWHLLAGVAWERSRTGGSLERQGSAGTKERTNPNACTSGRRNCSSLLEPGQILPRGSDIAVLMCVCVGGKASGPRCLGGQVVGFSCIPGKKVFPGRRADKPLSPWALIPSEREEEEPRETQAAAPRAAQPCSTLLKQGWKVGRKPATSLGSLSSKELRSPVLIRKARAKPALRLSISAQIKSRNKIFAIMTN